MINPDIREQVDLIRQVFAYTEKFKDSTFVIKISDEVIDHPDFPQHAGDISLLHNAGIKIIIVPGARKRIDEVLDKFGVSSDFKDGIRITTPALIDLIKMAAFDVSNRVMTALSGHKTTAVIGNWVRARSLGVIDGVDYSRTGVVDRIRVDAVSRSLELGHVAIFPCIGHNESGDPYNLSSDELALTVAMSLNAKKLFFLTMDPVMKIPEWKIPDSVEVLEDGRIFRMPPSAVDGVSELNKGKPGLNYLKTAAKACSGGVDRAHILDGRSGGVLLKEIFSNLGAGTMVYADAYERLRPMELSDVPGILEIMNPLIEEGILVIRTREDLERKYSDYWVYAMDGVVHGCAALHSIDEKNCEIAGLAVDPKFAQLGIGAKLVSKLTEEAEEKGFSRIFVLTTRTSDWFLARGFREGTPADLPPARLKDYSSGRNSKVLIKKL